MDNKLIFVVEDEKNIAELIQFNLEEQGYEVLVFGDGESMLQHSTKEKPMLFILDIMLPGINGLEICKRLRGFKTYRQTPIIMLTAKSEEFDKILGLELGADDYITKPFSVKELITRVKVAVRRLNYVQTEDDSHVIKTGYLKINLESHQVYRDGKPIYLSYKEFELLKLLIANKGKVLSRESILDSIWGMDYDGGTRTVDVHIRYLRQKIELDDKYPEYLETVRGIGYRFNLKKD